ncbi:MAG: TetR/AcrR family transcriptional regulator [Niabella sp.]
MKKNYKDVIIVDIEKATGMSRRAVFYYVKDKNELLGTVVDQFILTRQNIHNKITPIGNNSFKEFIDSYLQGVINTMEAIAKAEVDNILRSYFGLIFNSVSYYDGFAQKTAQMLSLEISVWEKFIEMGMQSGELKSDINPKITALNFQSIFYGLAFISSLNAGMKTDELRNCFNEYYNSIRK